MQKPTEKQKHWLEQILGAEVWRELCQKGEFLRALDTSLAQSRRIALRYLAEKERLGKITTCE